MLFPGFYLGKEGWRSDDGLGRQGPVFFRVGITPAILKPEGTTPESSEQLTMVAIEGQMPS